MVASGSNNPSFHTLTNKVNLGGAFRALCCANAFVCAPKTNSQSPASHPLLLVNGPPQRVIQSAAPNLFLPALPGTRSNNSSTDSSTHAH